MPIRVLVVDDSAFMRRALSAIIESDAELELIGTAFNGRNALQQIEKLEPDVITMDIEMPELDGIGALKELMATNDNPPAVLMCSSLTVEGSQIALEALQHGAADVIAKPTSSAGIHESPDAKLMLAKIRGVSKHRKQFHRHARARQAANTTGTTKAESPPIARPSVAITSLPKKSVSCVVVGSSTGGPPALEAFLNQFPADINVPIVIAQHMPPMFTQSLASRLDSLTALTVVHAETGMPLLPGTAYIAQGGKHLEIARIGAGRSRLEVTQQPAEALYKPSVNVLFDSAANVYGNKVLGVMLTGMGDDGLTGSKSLVDAGGMLLGQDEASCVVYGMPRAVQDAGLVAAQFDPTELGRAVMHLAGSNAGAGSPGVHAA